MCCESAFHEKYRKVVKKRKSNFYDEYFSIIYILVSTSTIIIKNYVCILHAKFTQTLKWYGICSHGCAIKKTILVSEIFSYNKSIFLWINKSTPQ